MNTPYRKCKIDGCENVGEVNKRAYGKVYRRPLCSKHKRIRYGSIYTSSRSKKIDLLRQEFGSKCHICGWEGPCDVHRIIPRTEGGSYTKENVIFICPNCHRLHHKGIKKLDV